MKGLRRKSVWSRIATANRSKRRQEAIETMAQRMAEAACRRLQVWEHEYYVALYERLAREQNTRRDER